MHVTCSVCSIIIMFGGWIMFTIFNCRRIAGWHLRRAHGLWLVVFAIALCGSGCKKSDREQVLIAAMTDNVRLLTQMDERGADLNAQYSERFNWTPLITAIYFQKSNVIAYLLNRSVDVRKRDGTGKTALMMSISLDDTNTAMLLFQKSPQAISEGEDWPTVRSLIQAPPRDQASQKRWNSLVDEFLRTNIAAQVHR